MQQSATVIPKSAPSAERRAKRARARAKACMREGTWKNWVKKNGNKLKKPNQYNLVWFDVA